MAIANIENNESGLNVRTKLNTVIGAVNGTETGSYTGSFTGDGSGLSNIPPSGIVGGISAFQIASGSATASIAPGNFNVNTNTTITGSLTVSGSTELSGSLDLNLSESGSVFSISEGSDITFDVDEFEMTGSMSVTGSLDVNTNVLSVGSSDVGIGTSSPTAKLDVNGTGNFRNTLTVAPTVASDVFIGNSAGNSTAAFNLQSVSTTRLRILSDSTRTIFSSQNQSEGFRFNKSTEVFGNLTVTGKVTAEEFYTEYVSASVIYESGSTQFGDSLDDTHIITGSMNLTGSLDVNGDFTVTGSANYSLSESGSFVIGDSSDIEFDVDTFLMTGSMDISGSLNVLGTSIITGSIGIEGGLITSSNPLLDLKQEWSGSAVTFTGIKLNVTDTASDSNSLLMDLQVGSSSKFSVDKDGDVIGKSLELNSNFVLNGDGSQLYLEYPAVNQIPLSFRSYNYPIVLPREKPIAWCSVLGNASSGTIDTFLYRDAAQTLAQRNSTNAQTFNIYNTYTDSSNYERGFLKWNSNVLEIGAEELGTGTLRGVKIGTAATSLIGFYDATAIVQPTTGITEATFAENAGGTTVNDDSTFGGYTIGQVVQALQNLGLLA